MSLILSVSKKWYCWLEWERSVFNVQEFDTILAWESSQEWSRKWIALFCLCFSAWHSLVSLRISRLGLLQKEKCLHLKCQAEHHLLLCLHVLASKVVGFPFMGLITEWWTKCSLCEGELFCECCSYIHFGKGTSAFSSVLPDSTRGVMSAEKEPSFSLNKPDV